MSWIVLTGVVLVAAGVTAADSNVARMPGVVAVADTEHRDRWGLDGHHAQYVHDGNLDGSGQGSRTASWASDNWEATHTIALVLPKRVRASRVAIHWAKPGDEWLEPRQYAVGGLRDEAWLDLVHVRNGKGQARTVHTFPATEIDAVRVMMPPEGAHPAADRRLWIAEIEVQGEPLEPARPVDVEAAVDRIRRELADGRRREDAARVAPLLKVAMRWPKRSGFMAIVDREDLQRGRRNVATRPWAKAFLEGVRKDADWWLAQSDQAVYDLVPAGNPRALCPQFEKGCPIHGGARHSFTATLEKPYRWRCREGGEWWHDGAVVKNPQTGEPVTVRDDGGGWLAPAGFPGAGRRYYFVAAYRYFLLGKLLSGPYEPDGGSRYGGGTPVVQLALAYALTDDRRYAHKCAVMLNRLAELYRTYDGCVEGPSQRQDGYIGQTFERFLVQNLILACDLIWDTIEDDKALHQLFAAKGDVDYNGDGRVTGADFTYNLQRNLLGFVYEYLHRLMPYMDGDFLMYEMTALAALANCLGNPEIAAEALESDLGLRVLLGNSWFRDGKFIYDSCGYNVGNARTPLEIAEWLHGFRAPPRYPQPIDLYHHPDYRMAMLYDFLRHVDCDGRVPQIGDSGGSRACQLRVRPPYDRYDERALVRLPEERDFYRARLEAAADGDLEAYRRGRADWWMVFHVGRDERSAAPATKAEGPTSHLFPDSGIAILRGGRDAATRQHVSLTFSKGSYGHGHADKLAVNVFRYGYDLSADLGYPRTWTDLKCGGWVKHTAGHCTVMLDERPQRYNASGRLHFFATQPLWDVVEASAEAAYPGATLYRRTVALVRDEAGEPLYTIDVFRVAGAATRDYLFHSLGRPEDLRIAAAGAKLNWVKQAKGSLAGVDVEPMTEGGYGFLRDVARAKTGGPVTARWLSHAGQSQPDRYLLTRRTFGDFVADFTITRTGKASGKRERAGFVFDVDPGNQSSRRFAWLDAGGTLPVAKPVKARIEVTGATARVFMDGKLTTRSVDSVGTPPAQGVIGFLHYFNYAYEYRDLVITPAGGEPVRVGFAKPLDPETWGKIDPTYAAGGGVLHVRDSETVGLDLHLVGSAGEREIIRAAGEGYGLRGPSPLEGHFIARDHRPDPSSPSLFVAVLEAHRGAPRILSVDAMEVDGDVAAVRVRTRNRVDYVLSALDTKRPVTAKLPGSRIEFRGRFGHVVTRDGKTLSLGVVGDGFIACGDRRVESPGDVRGRIVSVDAANDAVRVQIDASSGRPSDDPLGRHLLVHNPAFVCPGVYRITGVKEESAGMWRIGLSMPLAVARGVVASVDTAKGSFATRTPVMKLRVNPGLFDGKRVRATGDQDSAWHVLKTATESAFVLAAPAALKAFRPGTEYTVYDLGVGDRIEVVSTRTAKP